MTKSMLTINGRKVRASVGDTLIDAALENRILIPHDCCSGQCDTCKVRVVSGAVDDNGTLDGPWVLGCQATVAGDAEITFEEVPVPTKVAGSVVSILPLSANIVEIVVQLDKAFDYLPGQYVNATFFGYPAREYSPTPRLDGRRDPREIVFHIRVYPNGAVSSALGRRISFGHRVRIHGPFGHAFHRKGAGRLILVSTGTGFAPIWSIAHAAALAEPQRPIGLILGARHARDLYMRRAVNWLFANGQQSVRLSATETSDLPYVARGRVTEFLPEDLGPGDTVVAAGAPAMVDAVKRMAYAAGAECYADPFTASRTNATLLDRLVQFTRQRPAASAGSGPSSAPSAANAARQPITGLTQAPGSSRAIGSLGQLLRRT
jgi:3-phenylpropionate/trans-cinnamate dioxygenase ferredoxin reductase subunit